MKTLGASIVQRGIASVSDVEEALARQVMYGGDLATNLLELASVSEHELTELLALSHGLHPAPRGELPASSGAVLRLVPGDLAFRHGFYPLFEEAGTLTVAVAEPLAQQVEQDLSFALGVTIVQLAAPLVRIRQAVARDYDMPLDKRTDKIIAKLMGTPASLSEPPRVDFNALPRPETLPPGAYAEENAPVDMDAATAPPPEAYPLAELAPEDVVELPSAAASDDHETPFVEASPAAGPEVAESVAPAEGAGAAHPSQISALKSAAYELARASSPPSEKAPRRLGPYTAADAERDLMLAEERDDVLGAFFDFAAQYFEYCALFVIHGDLAEGRDARGPGASQEQVRALGVPLDVPSTIANVHESGKWQLARLTGGGIDASLAKDLGRQSGPQCLLLPITMRQRTVLIFYGDHGADDVKLANIGDVISFAPLIAQGLERVILKRKRAIRNTVAADRLSSNAPPRREPRTSIPPAVQRARALAGALGESTRPPERPSSVPTSGDSAESAPRTDAKAAPVSKEVAAPKTERLPMHKARSPLPARTVANTATGMGPNELSLEPDRALGTQNEAERLDLEFEGDEEADSRTSVVPQRVLSIEPPQAEPSGDLTRTQLSPGSSGPPPAESAASGNREGGTPKSEMEPSESGWDLESQAGGQARSDQGALESPKGPDIAVGAADYDQEISDAIAREELAPLAPPSRSVAYSARPPSKRQSSEELRLPSVIVDFESDSRALVQRLCSGDLEAGEKLVEMGPQAVSALVAEFPGPLTGEPRRSIADSMTRASDCGPVLRVLARIGSPAVPFLAVRTADSNPEVRAWATRLLGELPNRESAAAVARRLIDDNQEVRRAALAAARMHQKDVQARAAVREHLAELAQDAYRSTEARHGALEALSDIRDPESIPIFIRVLGDKNRELVKSAHWGLAVLARTDLGSDAKEWERWWRKNAGRHRIEWLIDALMHDSPEIRRAAGDELKSITKEYFGYYDDLPKKERAGAQARYREWWESKGKFRFP